MMHLNNSHFSFHFICSTICRISFSTATLLQNMDVVKTAAGNWPSLLLFHFHSENPPVESHSMLQLRNVDLYFPGNEINLESKIGTTCVYTCVSPLQTLSLSALDVSVLAALWSCEQWASLVLAPERCFLFLFYFHLKSSALMDFILYPPASWPDYKGHHFYLRMSTKLLSIAFFTSILAHNLQPVQLYL